MHGLFSEMYGAVVASKSLISFFTHFGVATSEDSNRNFVGLSTYLKHNTNTIVCEFLFQNVNLPEKHTVFVRNKTLMRYKFL